MAYTKYLNRIKRRLAPFAWWQIAFFIIGIIALLSVVGGLFIASGSAPKRLHTGGPVPSVNDEQFRSSLASIVHAPLEQGGPVTVLHNGDGFYPALIAAINEAKKTINFSVYIWEDGQASDMIIDALLEKQRQGVQVRVLLDGLGSTSAPDDRFEELKQTGAKVESFRTPQFGKLTRYHRRNHRRAIIIDGHTGFTGGMAVSDSWLGNAQDENHWRDMMFKVEGPMAISLQQAFVDHWASSTGEMLIGEDFYPAHPANSETNRIQYIHLVSSPADDSLLMSKFMLLPMMAARHKLYIATPYFVGDRDVMETLMDKAKNGIDVRLLLPGPNIDNKTARWGAQNYYQDLLEAGVKIYEYQPTFMHSKFISVDDSAAVIGSPNLNSRSRRLDEENAMAVFDTALATELSKTFEADIQNARLITEDDWQRRNPFTRLLQYLSRLLAQQS